MLVTESGQGLYGRSNMTSSLHARGHVNGGFPTPNSQPYISARSNFSGGSQGLFPPLMAPAATQPPASGIPQRDDNIMNRRADMNSSLYQICLGLRMRLAEVPGFAQHIAEMEEEEAEVEDSTDPVTSLWNCLRRGYPLMTIYNALEPAVPLRVDPSRIAEAKIGKTATFKFLQACLTELMFPPNECFLITDLYGGDTTGFVKVTKVVNRVLDLLSQKGLLLLTEHKPANGHDGQKPQNFTYRQNVVNEIVVTERDYVQHLETLQQFKNEIEESGAIAGDAVHDIFLNLNALLDFQRRFLIRIEQQNSLPESQQNWGQLFIQYKESFRVYEPFIANQTRCNEAVMKEWDKLKAAPLSPALNGLLNTQHILNGFLLKPFQRLSKYPMLLRDLRLRGGLDEERNADLAEGEATAGSILDRANEALGKEHRLAAMTELQSRVEDWKGHKMEQFGDLLLYGTFTVLKGEGAKEVERKVRNIFDSQNPRCRTLIRRACHRGPTLHVSHPRANERITSPEITPMASPVSSEFKDSPESVREGHASETNEELLTQRSLGTHDILVGPDISPRATMQSDAGSKGVRKKRSPSSLLSKANLTPPVSGSSKAPSTSNLLSKSESVSQLLLIQPFEGSGGRCRADQSTPSRRRRVKASRTLTRFGAQFKSRVSKRKKLPRVVRGAKYAHDPCNFLYLFNGPFFSPTPLLFTAPMAPRVGALSTSREIYAEREKQNWKPARTMPTKLEKELANELGYDFPKRVQYKVYLFERILLCCKEINPNKPKNKMLGTNKPLTDKKGKLRLQLKGRIFMNNVTDVLSVVKSDKPLYTIQIFWKDDPGVENFGIRFATEDLMNKWRDQVTMLKQIPPRSSGQPGTSETEFTSMKNQVSLENPYLQDDDAEEDDSQGSTLVEGQSNVGPSRNASSNSLRTAATLAGSSMLPLDRSTSRIPSSRFPPPEHANKTYTPPLSLHTNLPPNLESSVDFAGNSYFSPTAESPISTRSSSQTPNYFLPRQATPSSGWPNDDNKHKTAPAMSNTQSRDATGTGNSYIMNGRTVQRPSLPAMAQNPQQLAMAQSRLRSVSTPDIHNTNSSGPRRYANGQLQPPVDNTPVPPMPSHIAQMRAPVNRSQANSPINTQNLIRSATQSPQLQQHRQPQQADIPYRVAQQNILGITASTSPSATLPTPQLTPQFTSQLGIPLQPIRSPAPSQSVTGKEIPYPSQLKVKIWFDPSPSHVTIVVPIIIKHRSLIDRIDSKMVKISSASISNGTARLRYRDGDGDILTIASDEDVSLAIEDWALSHLQQLYQGVVGDFELYWHEN